MVQANEIISSTTSKLTGFLTNINWMYIIGWILFSLVGIGGAFWGYKYYKNKGYNIYTAQVGRYYSPIL